jgi:GNAT superfamily N-acetyltransferase
MRWLGQAVGRIQDWSYSVRRDGWRSALSYTIDDILALPYHHTKFVVMARSLLEPLPELKPKIALEIREFEAADLDQVRRINRPSEARICAQRLDRGHRGVVAQYEGQVIGYGWGCTEMSLERMPVQLGSSEILCTDAYTAPAFRGKGVQTVLMLARMQMFRDLGYNRILTCIIEDNYPSLAVWRKVDSQVVQRGDFRRIGPWRQVRYSQTALIRGCG